MENEPEASPIVPDWRVRRAVVDDLAALAELWREAQMPAQNFEKNFTDFQVVEDGEGRLRATVAMEISGHFGRLHSEAIADFALADTLRPLLWARLQGVAQNHGIYRLWTLEAAPFWKKDAGFAPPGEDVKQKFPEAFGSADQPWLTLRLREEGADPEALERQFEAFRATEQARRERLLSQVAPLKWVGLAIAAALFVVGMIALAHVLLSMRR